MSVCERVILGSLYVFRFALKKLFWGEEGYRIWTYCTVSAHVFETKRQEVIIYTTTKMPYISFHYKGDQSHWNFPFSNLVEHFFFALKTWQKLLWWIRAHKTLQTLASIKLKKCKSQIKVTDFDYQSELQCNAAGRYLRDCNGFCKKHIAHSLQSRSISLWSDIRHSEAVMCVL